MQGFPLLLEWRWSFKSGEFSGMDLIGEKIPKRGVKTNKKRPRQNGTGGNMMKNDNKTIR
jgi:hypothetical protein